ncbi:MAG: tetratricopeptide repeat protein [Candidatus Theseobacter exili]|nr:tetratricopeptide repeat protein [Candidatus Theseobacter exili]
MDRSGFIYISILSVIILFANVIVSADESDKYLQYWEKTHQWESHSAEGIRLLAEKSYNSAAIEFIKAIDFGCPYGRVRYQLGLCYDNLGNYDLAEDYYLEALNKLKASDEPNKTKYLYNANLNLGYIFLKQGEYAEAETKFHEVLKMDSKNVNAYASLGYIYSEKKDYDRAIREYTKAVDINPGNAATQYNLGVMYLRKGNNKLAKDKFKIASKLDPTLKEPTLLETVYSKNRDKEKVSIAEIEQEQQKAKTAEKHLKLGNLLYEKNKYAEALVEYKKANDANPEMIEGYLNTAKLEIENGRPEKAAEAYAFVLQQNVDNYTLRVNYGKVLYDLGKHDESRAQFEKAVEINSTNPVIYYYIGVLNEFANGERYGLGFNSGDAEKSYLNALNIKKDYMEAVFNLGVLYIKIGQPEKAEKLMLEFVETFLDPQLHIFY